MEILLRAGIGVQFVTKANVPDNFIDLFAQSSNLVCAQVGITTIDDGIRRIFEPNTGSTFDRLSTMRELVRVGVRTGARADPLIHGVTDSDESLINLFSAIVEASVSEVAINYLFLRPAIRKSLERNIKDSQLLTKLLQPYSAGTILPIGMRNSRGVVLPKEIREKAFRRIRRIASDFGLSIHVCGCKNSDITNESCHITCLTYSTQLNLFISSFTASKVT